MRTDASIDPRTLATSTPENATFDDGWRVPKLGVQPTVGALSAGLAVYWVTFLWGFFERGAYALGVNATLFAVGVLFLVSRARGQQLVTRHNWLFMLPMLAMSLSFSLYDNPYLNTVTLGVFPLSLAVFAIHQHLSEHDRVWWSPWLAMRVFWHATQGTLGFWWPAMIWFRKWPGRLLEAERIRLIRRILGGLAAFAGMACVVVPLLSSVDSGFADRLDELVGIFVPDNAYSLAFKVLSACLIATVLLASTLGVSEPLDGEFRRAERTVDDVASGIAIAGVIGLYLLFAWVQVERLFTADLPISFRAAEGLVKDGFWQLLAVTGINIGAFYVVYRRTNRVVQILLGVFATASLLILASAGHRMWLYVADYGFSHEKVYACYAMLYCGGFLTYLLGCLFRRRTLDVMKAGAFGALWMYAALTLAPVERFILETNVALAQRDDSRMQLFDAKELSAEMLPLIERLDAAGVLAEDPAIRNEGHWASPMEANWDSWIYEARWIRGRKAWYELSAADWAGL